MEGITATIIYVILAAVIAVVLWLANRYKKPVETILEIADPAAAISKEIADLLVKDEEKKEDVIKYLDLLQCGVRSINRKKNEIDEALGRNATTKQRHDAYTKAALEITDELVSVTSGVKPDVLSKTGAKTAIDLILDKLPSEKNEVTYIDLKETKTH